MLEPDIILSNMVPLVSVELEYHTEWCALKSPSIRVYASPSYGPGKEGNLLRRSLKLVRWGMGLIVRYICKLMRIGR